MTSEAQGGTEMHGQAAGEPRRLRRRRDHRVVAGVCGGLADYFGLHPAIYRVIFVALTIAGGTGLLLYAAAALVMPVEGSDESLATQTLREHRDRPWLVIGVALLALGGIFVLSGPHLFWGAGGGIWALALLAGALIVIWEARSGGRGRAARATDDATAADRRPRDTRPSVFWPGLGLLLALAGLIGLLDAVDAVDVDAGVVLAAGVILVGGLVALGFFFRGAAPLAVIGLVLTVAVSGALALSDVSLKGGVGDRLVRPLTVSDLDSEYRLGIGELEIDLRKVELPKGETHVSARTGIGDLVIEVPEDVAVDVTGHVRGGDLDILGHEHSGWHVRDRVVDPEFEHASRRLVVDATVGLGDLEVRH